MPASVWAAALASAFLLGLALVLTQFGLRHLSAISGAAVLMMYIALANGPVVLVSPLVASYPLATLALSLLLPGASRVNARQIVGVLATVGGVTLLLSAWTP